MDIGERVIVHGFLEVDGIEDLDPVRLLSLIHICKCILQLRGVRPFLSDKYDITKHPNFKYTADADDKNAFDIEAFLSARLKLKPNEVCDVYEVDTKGA